MKYEELVEMARSAAVLWVTLRIMRMDSTAYYVSVVVDEAVQAAIEAKDAMMREEPEAGEIAEE